MATVISSASDNPIELEVSQVGAQGEPGANGTDGAGFSQVRGNLLYNPLTRILKRNEPVSVIEGSLDYTRNSAASYTDIYGDFTNVTNDLLRRNIFGYRFDGYSENLFINSESPATQDINLASDDYVLSIEGAGSVNTVFGNASEGSPVLFNTSGLTTFQVVGSVDRAQVEQGVKNTSFIVTQGTSQAREPDVMIMDVFNNIPNLTEAWSMLFYVNDSNSDYCVLDSTPLRVSRDTSGFWSVNGVTSTSVGGKSVVITYDGIADTNIYIDGVLSDTISVTYTNISSGTARVGARLDGTRPVIGDLLDLQFFDVELNEFEVELIKGEL